MLTFLFVALCLVLFGVSIFLGYIYLKRENQRQWKAYSRRAMQQVKTLRDQFASADAKLTAHIDWTATALKAAKPTSNNTFDIASFNPRKKMEDFAERQILEAVQIVEKAS